MKSGEWFQFVVALSAGQPVRKRPRTRKRKNPRMKSEPLEELLSPKELSRLLKVEV